LGFVEGLTLFGGFADRRVATDVELEVVTKFPQSCSFFPSMK
jgi:hypothetical protein